MMCAFMTPVLKNDWEVYATKKRSRNSSLSSQVPTSKSHPKDLRRRVLSESRCMSYSGSPAQSNGGPRRILSEGNTRSGSKSSFGQNNSDEYIPPKVHSKTQRSGSLKKFHAKVMQKLRSFHSKEKSENSPTTEKESESA